ncbi:MAG: DUF3375 domain-containing protein [Saprospiraceae bacterium]
MQHQEIRRLISFSPTVKLLRARSAPLVISFLHQEFKAQNRIVVPAYETINHLADYIEALDDRDVIDIEGSDSLQLARNYITQWCSEENRYLRRYPDDTGEPVLELTTHTEKAFQWMETLQAREFVGTESRFLSIYRQLKDLIDNTSADPKRKIKELEKQRKAINAEIKAIKKAGVVSTYNDTQIKERFYNVTKTARELIADFKEVEQNFKDISLNIYRQQTKADVHRGQILGYALDASEELKQSDQGRSFYAFWQFLIADNKQDELMEMIRYTYDLLKERDIDLADNFLRKIKIFLHNAGQKVINSNHLLADKLSRILSESNFAERRVARDVIDDIKNLAVQKVGKFSGKRAFIYIDDLPNIDLSLDRPLGEPKQVANFTNQPTEIGSTQLDNANLAPMFDGFEMDRQLLEENIASLLKKSAQISLAEVVKIHPIQNGLEEIITYFSIASTSTIHTIDTSVAAMIPWQIEAEETAQAKEIRLPEIVFRRE